MPRAPRAQPPSPQDRVDWFTRLAFGIGSFAEGIKNGAFSYFLLFYYNQVLGLSGSLAGAALLLALFFDAVTDPLVGSLSDSHRSRLGRRHPFMYSAALPFALVFFLVFRPPEGLGQWGLFAWLSVFGMASRGAMTLYSVPHMALAAELSPDYQERNALSSVRAFFSISGGIAALLIGFGYFFQPGDGFANGQLNPNAYPSFGAAAALAIAFTVFLSAAGTHHTIPKLHGPPRSEAGAVSLGRALSRLLEELTSALQLPAFRFLFSGLVAMYAVMGVLANLGVYVLTYFWELEGEVLGFQLSAGMAGMVLGAVLAAPAAAAIGDKRATAMIGIGVFSFFTGLLVNLRLLGVAPANESAWLAPLLIAATIVGGIGGGFLSVMGTSMIADVTDEHERVHGVRQEGIYFSSVSFSYKATSGLGTLLAGIAIDAVGLTPGTAPGDVLPLIVQSLGWLYGPITLALSLIPIALLRHYDIGLARHAEIRRELTARGPR